MATITAQPDPQQGLIRITLGGEGTVLAVTRNDVNGQQLVRTRPDVLPWTGPGDLAIEDYEAGHGPVTYTAEMAAGEPVSASVQLALAGPWFGVPVMPQYSLPLRTVHGYGASRDSTSSEVVPLGRGDVIVIMRPLGPRRGQLQLVAGTFAAAAEIEAACDRGEILQLRQPEHAGMDMYFTARNVGISPLEVGGDNTLWGVDLGYTAVPWPAGYTNGSRGWDFEALAAGYADFDTIERAFLDMEAIDLRTPRV